MLACSNILETKQNSSAAAAAAIGSPRHATRSRRATTSGFGARAGVPPHAGPWEMVLTWEEMEAQLDRLDEKTDESDDAGVDG